MSEQATIPHSPSIDKSPFFQRCERIPAGEENAGACKAESGSGEGQERTEGKKKEKTGTVAKKVEKQAVAIKFSDQVIFEPFSDGYGNPIGIGVGIDRNDYNAIEKMMTSEEKLEMRSKLIGYRDDWVAEQIREITPEVDREEKRRELEGEYNFDDDRIEYLRQFYDDNEEIFGSGWDKSLEDKTWYPDDDNEWWYRFETSTGVGYFINVYDQNTFGQSVQEVQFKDEKGKFKITGAGNAHEVFSSVVPAIVSYVGNKKPNALAFSAAEPSRRRLYNRLVKSVSQVAPEYSGIIVEVGDEAKARWYVLVKRDERDQTIEKIKTAVAATPNAGEPKIEVLVKHLVIGVNSNWWGEKSWLDVDILKKTLNSQRNEVPFDPHKERVAESLLIRTKSILQSELRDAIATAARETETDLTDDQRKSGDYTKGKFTWNGYTIAIESPQGSIRSGMDVKGNRWSVVMRSHYGFFIGKGKKMKGADGDAVDVFVGPNPESEIIFVIDQFNPDGLWDEHKCVVGVDSAEEARLLYLSNYSPSWTGFGGIVEMNLEQFGKWIKSDWTKKPAAEWKSDQDGEEFAKRLEVEWHKSEKALEIEQKCMEGENKGEPGPCPKRSEGTGSKETESTGRSIETIVDEKSKIGQEINYLARMSGAQGYVGINPEYQEEYRRLIKKHDELRRELYEAERPEREAKEKADKERQDAAWDRKEKRVAGLPTKQRKNGWEIVDDGGVYHVRDPHTKESIYEGKLSRCRQVASESPPDNPTPLESPETSQKRPVPLKVKAPPYLQEETGNRSDEAVGPHIEDPIREITPDNVKGVWERIKQQIASGDSKLSPNLAGEIAAARIVNAYRNRAKEFVDGIDADVREGKQISDEDDALYIAVHDSGKKIQRKLESISGVRDWSGMRENPLAKVSLGTKTKALSYLNETSGGALVPPAPSGPHFAMNTDTKASLRELRQKYRRKPVENFADSMVDRWQQQTNGKGYWSRQSGGWIGYSANGKKLIVQYGGPIGVNWSIGIQKDDGSISWVGSANSIEKAKEEAEFVSSQMKGIGKFGTKSLTAPKVKESYFATCPRDAHGKCKPKGEADERAKKEEAKPESKKSEESVSDTTAKRAKEEYDTLKEAYLKKNASFGADGKPTSISLNTDDWRELFPEYHGTNAMDVHAASSYLNKRLLAEALETMKGKGNNTMIVLAGGGGSGKSGVGKFTKIDDYPIRLDQVSDELESLEGKMQKAKENGFKLEYVFVDRQPQEAWLNGVVKRAVGLRKKGEIARTVPIQIAVKANIDARKTAIELLKKNPDFPVSILDNTKGFESTRLIKDRDEAIKHLESQNYDQGKLLKELEDETIKLHDSGEIPEDIAAGLVGADKLKLHRGHRQAKSLNGQLNQSKGETDEPQRVHGRKTLSVDNAKGLVGKGTANAGRISVRSGKGASGQRKSYERAATKSLEGTRGEDGSVRQSQGRTGSHNKGTANGRIKSLAAPQVKQSYFATCPRDKRGKCKPKGQGDEASESEPAKQPERLFTPEQARVAITTVGSLSWEGVKKTCKTADHVEHVIKDWTASHADKAVSHLPPTLQKLVRGTFIATRLGTATAFISYTAGQKAAELVARKQGATPEQAATLRKIVSAIDIVAAKPVVIGLTALGMGAIAPVASMVPVGSMTYLAYSGAKQSLKVAQSAKRAVDGVLGKFHKDIGEYEGKGWVTMGGESCDQGKHCGGTHVELDSEGKIEKGPKGTIGKKPDELKTESAKVGPSPFAKPEDSKERLVEKPAAHDPDLKETAKTSGIPDYVGKKISNSKQAIKDTERKLNESQGTYLQKLPQNQAKAIEEYTSDAYEDLNRKMRQCPPDFNCVKGGTFERLVAELEKAIANAPSLPEPVMAYRGVDMRDLKLRSKMESNLKGCLNSGTEFTFGQFVSTTIWAGNEFIEDIDKDSGFIFQIKAKKGLYVESISSNPGEKEFLQSANTKYKVVAFVDDVKFWDVNKDASTRKQIVYLEEV